jgi:hypothetical protein
MVVEGDSLDKDLEDYMFVNVVDYLVDYYKFLLRYCILLDLEGNLTESHHY